MRSAPSIETLRELATLFTRPLFAEMSEPRGKELVSRKLEGVAGILRNGQSRVLRELFEQVFALLATYYRNEYVFKSAVAHAVIPEQVNPGIASVQIEFPVVPSILDVAAASDTTRAFEIKTDFDSSRRLDSQAESYLKVFDEVYLVTTEKSLSTFSRKLDSRVGLVVLNDEGSLVICRNAVSNKSNLQHDRICAALRQKERISALERRTGQPIIMPNGLVGAYCARQFAEISPLELHEIFVDAMRKRSDAGLKDGFIHKLPRSLRALGYATPLSGVGRRRLLETLDTPVSFALEQSLAMAIPDSSFPRVS